MFETLVNAYDTTRSCLLRCVWPGKKYRFVVLSSQWLA